MTAIYRIEIEIHQPDEVDWQNYAIDAMFEAFGTRKAEHIAGPNGVDLTLDNSDYDANVRMTGPHDDIAPAPASCTADEITSRIYNIADLIRGKDIINAFAELANLRDAVLGVQEVGS